ncbi:energy-coupling factor transporter transmembrane component T [Campylobacter sp. CX2-4080-23]|uniref:energy-coupling factor transporter transmembrane component T n=1 Tax=Campylobacter porcelli TaxID=1660073 RepID=UPI002ECA0A6D|nr:energy-coupling factor transporter transmembrane component T [Campylobacter sp. CX2-4080-23]
MINPSISLLCFFIFSFFLALSGEIYLTHLLPIIFLSLIKFRYFFEILKRLFFLNLFIILVALSVILSDNYHLALLIFIRSNLIILFGLLLFHKMDFYDMAFGISRLGLGSKISYLFYFCIRFIQMAKMDFYKFKRTLKARNFSHTTSIFAYQTYANLVAMLFLGTFEKSQILEKTMQIRGFNGKFYKLENSLKFEFYDILLIILLLISLIFKQGVLI